MNVRLDLDWQLVQLQVSKMDDCTDLFFMARKLIDIQFKATS